MKITKAKSIILKNMVRQFYETGTEIFTFDTVQAFMPDVPKHIINKALYDLGHDGFISVFEADNIAYSSSLLSNAIINVDENTLLKKGYDFIKEIKSFF